MVRPAPSAAVALLVAVITLGAGCTDVTPSPAEAAVVPGTQGSDLLEQRSKGSPTAPVRVVEMSDFQCPWCRRFSTETAALLDQEYVATGKVRWIFINFPISQLHPNAVAAAEMAMCSATQGKFWPMHDLLFKYQDKWAPLREPGQFLLTLADSLHIARDSIVPCLQEGRTRALVQRDANTASRLGAQSTPSFLIEGALLSGAYPVDLFRHVLDSIYRAKTAPR
ncbi:MAG: thioredoxin domain-containing protein [Gemmatimonadales bacterium]